MGGVNEEDLPEGVKAGVHAPRGAEEPPGQESEGPYERRSACNGRGAKGPREVDGVKLTQPERTPATVPEATHAGEVRSRWAWTEPTVWTDRMLTALEQGVQGGKWFRLMDKVYAAANLAAAYREVAANGGAAGVDHVTIAAFGHHLEQEVQRLAQ